jgi:hypothetical protein
MRKTGIILALLGITFGAVAVMFASGYQPKAGFLGSLPAMELVLKPGTAVQLADEPVTDQKAFFQWEDAAGNRQTSDRAPAEDTAVRNFKVTTQRDGRWSARPGRTRTELRGQKTLPLRDALAFALFLLMLGLGQTLLSKHR